MRTGLLTTLLSHRHEIRCVAARASVLRPSWSVRDVLELGAYVALALCQCLVALVWHQPPPPECCAASETSHGSCAAPVCAEVADDRAAAIGPTMPLCGICLEPMEDGSSNGRALRLACHASHRFHAACLDLAWAHAGHSKCPYCRNECDARLCHLVRVYAAEAEAITTTPNPHQSL